MAEKRMFSLSVVDQDKFLDMGSTARLLYYDLGVRADDDGFITPNKVLRMTGASADDLKILCAKGYLHMFEDGVIVILDWKINNTLKKDRYKPSVYNPRLREVKEKYALGATVSGSNLEPQISIGKYRIEKNRKDISINGFQKVSDILPSDVTIY